MQQIVFEKRVSKGSRFNQIYIPKDMEKVIEVGDLVKVKLLKKQAIIYYRKQKSLSEFKEEMVKWIFSELQRFDEIKTVFIVGSFLYETVYNDIDIVIVVDKERQNLEKEIEESLTKRFNQRFHLLLFNEENLKALVEKDPLTRAMLDTYISNKKIKFRYKRVIDEKHIMFLLMMPEDILEITLPSKVFYDNLRRLVVIKRFLRNKPLTREGVLNEINNLLDIDLLNKIKNNREINKNEITMLRNVIKHEIIKIKEMINNEEKWRYRRINKLNEQGIEA